MTRAWLHIDGLAPCVLPVTILSAGPKRARVRLAHRLRWNRAWYPAGSTRYVPTFAVSAYPGIGDLISTGGGTFVNPASLAANRAVKRWTGWVAPESDRSARERLSKMRAAGLIGRAK